MVGLSHCATRMAMQEFLPKAVKSLWPTEMLSSRRLPYQSEEQTPEIFFRDRDRGLVPQLLGNEESFIRDSIKKLEDWGAEAIDINMGCPVKHVLQHNYGVALMGDGAYAKSVTEMAVRSTSRPVSVKLRAGLQSNFDFLLQFAKGLEEAGASWVTLHPRTAEQKRRGSADWSQIRRLKEQLKIPVVGNGDVQCKEDIHAMFSSTKCDRVMMGRALLAKPWLVGFGVEEAEKNFPQNPSEEAQLYGRFLLRALDFAEEFYVESWTLRKMKFLIYHSSPWLDYGHTLYANTCKAADTKQMRWQIEEFFKWNPLMRDRTDLRR